MIASQFIIEEQHTCSGIIDASDEMGSGCGEGLGREAVLEKDAGGKELEQFRKILTIGTKKCWSSHSVVV